MTTTIPLDRETLAQDLEGLGLYDLAQAIREGQIEALDEITII